MTADAPGRRPGAVRGFTLMELLVVVAVLAILAAVLLPAVGRSLDRGRSAQCTARQRQLGLAVRQFGDDHDDLFPRSQHSAFANRELPWGRALAPYLGATTSAWNRLLFEVYHCPGDKRAGMFSYGLNVYFELGASDGYAGKPATWRHHRDVPRPPATILYAENAGAADHIMPHFWGGPLDAEDVDQRRHAGRANYTFVDGHVEALAFEQVYDPARGVDRWHPDPAP